MGSYAEAYNFRKEFIDESIAIRESANSVTQLSPYEELQRIREQREEQELKACSIRKNTMIHFLEGAINHILDKSFSEGKYTNNMSTLKSNIVHDFVVNEGALALTESFKGKSYLLSELHRLVHKYTDLIMEDVDLEKDEESEIPEQTDEEFYKELDNTEDINGIGSTIALRVTNAEEKFMQDNIDDKEKIQDIVKQSSNLVAASDNDDSTNPIEDEDDDFNSPEDEEESETEEPVRNESVIMVNGYISDRKERRPRTIFEQMVMNLSESIMKDDKTRKVYTETASERLDMKLVVETARCMYTFLEMLNTCKIKNFTEKEIKETLNNL